MKKLKKKIILKALLIAKEAIELAIERLKNDRD
jgi:hypothetical protein